MTSLDSEDASGAHTVELLIVRIELILAFIDQVDVATAREEIDRLLDSLARLHLDKLVNVAAKPTNAPQRFGVDLKQRACGKGEMRVGGGSGGRVQVMLRETSGRAGY